MSDRPSDAKYNLFIEKLEGIVDELDDGGPDLPSALVTLTGKIVARRFSKDLGKAIAVSRNLNELLVVSIMEAFLNDRSDDKPGGMMQ